MRKGLILVGVLVFVVAAYLLLRFDSGTPLEATPPPLATPRSEARPERVEPVLESGQMSLMASTIPSITMVLPDLDESDPFVRERLRSFGLPEEWTAKEHLVRLLAVSVDGMVHDDIPRRQLSFLIPEVGFRVVMSDGRLYADPANAERFDVYLDRLEAIDPATLASLLESLRPLIDQAVAELGGEMTGGEAIRTAIDRVLEIPIRREALELVQPKVFYEYADEDLEVLPPLEKQLLRLGPTNLERLQSYLVELRVRLDSN